MLGGTGPRLTEDADRVRVVHEQPRAVSLADLDYPRQIDDVAFHREHSVDGDELPARRHPRQLRVELVEIAVAEPNGLTRREEAAVDDARVIELVDEDGVVAPHERGDDAEVRLEASREDERRRLAR